MNLIIELNDIEKSFGKNVVLKNLNLKINEGDRIAILGENGSGKSTLINLMLGFLKVDNGKITYHKHNNKDNFIKNVGVQFQSESFPDNYKIGEIIDISFDFHYNVKFWKFRKWKKKIRNPEKEKLVKLFNLENKLDYKIKNLSGGEKQRLNILVSIISKPDVLILDEVSTGLDIKAQSELLNYINNFVKENNITLIIISHLIHEIEVLSNKIVILNNGKIEYTSDLNSSNRDELEEVLDKYFLTNKKVEVPDEFVGDKMEKESMHEIVKQTKEDFHNEKEESNEINDENKNDEDTKLDDKDNETSNHENEEEINNNDEDEEIEKGEEENLTNDEDEDKQVEEILDEEIEEESINNDSKIDNEDDNLEIENESEELE